MHDGPPASGWRDGRGLGAPLCWLTLRLRHDLQFMDSRGSLLIRRVGRRSMPTCGRAMATGWIPDISRGALDEPCTETLIALGAVVQ